MRYSLRCLPSAVLRRTHGFFSNAYWAVANAIAVWLSGITHGRHFRVRGRCYFMARQPSDIVFGDNVTVESRFFANIVGLTGPSVFHALGGGRIFIGNRTGLSAPVISSRSSVVIGSRCKIGGNVRIFDHDFHSLDPVVRASSADSMGIRSQPIVIGDDVFIGANALILKGSKIGDRSIVAAGSVVFGLDVPPDSLVKGNPAYIVSRRDK